MAKKKKIKSPTQLELVEPTFSALVELGGSATISEIYERVVAMLNLPDSVIDEPHKGDASQQTELEYQLAWARTRLKNYGAIANSKRGVWMITPEFADKTSISRSDVTEHIKKTKLAGKTDAEAEKILSDGDPTNDGIDAPEELEPWKTELADTLHNMNPYVTSFSEADDALAMWNYYSKGSRYEGINIGIRTQVLLDSLEMNGRTEGKIKACAFKVIYDDAQQRKMISTFIEELFSKYAPGDESTVRYHISTMLSSLKMLFKNKCFEHEKEVRVVVQIFKKYKAEVPVKYRTYAGYIIPYIELRFDKGAVCQLTTGPMVGTEQQKKLQQTVIHEMLESHDYYVSEKNSEIPVRY